MVFSLLSLEFSEGECSIEQKPSTDFQADPATKCVVFGLGGPASAKLGMRFARGPKPTQWFHKKLPQGSTLTIYTYANAEDAIKTITEGFKLFKRTYDTKTYRSKRELAELENN